MIIWLGFEKVQDGVVNGSLGMGGLGRDQKIKFLKSRTEIHEKSRK